MNSHEATDGARNGGRGEKVRRAQADGVARVEHVEVKLWSTGQPGGLDDDASIMQDSEDLAGWKPWPRWNLITKVPLRRQHRHLQ